MDATVELGKSYSLDKLKFYVYKGEIESAGKDLKIEIYSNGTWTTKFNLTNAELASYLKTGNSISGHAWLEFDMAGAKASQIRISSTGTMTDKTTTFYEVTCSVNA